ncbi:MAG TPA: IPT/TIG domain-containing protein [Bryobacteraceae bacterium]|jgi:uncharacterized protein (TIGR03437 family)
MKYLTALFLLAMALASPARAASTLYAATSLGPFKSTDSGVTWIQQTVTANDPALTGVPKILAVVLDPQTPSTVYAIGKYDLANGMPLAFLKSTDAGANWSVVSKPTFTFTGTDGGSLTIDPVRTNVLYAMNNSGGLEVTTDGGVTWSAPTIPKPTGSASQGTPNQPGLNGVATDPNHSGVVYVIGGNASFHPGKGYLFKSTDFGNTWTLLTSTAGFGHRIFINPKNSLEMYGTSIFNIGCTDPSGLCGIYKSTDGGQSWTELNIPESVVQTIGIDVTPGLLYAWAYDGLEDANVYRSVDGGITWKTVFPDSTSLVPNFGYVVRADLNAANTAYAVGPNDTSTVSKTTDGGLTWTPYKVQESYKCGNQICMIPAVIYDLVVAPQAAGPSQPPTISLNGVVNGASFQPGIVANSWVTIQGANLAPKTDDWSNSIVNGALPTSLDGVSVSMGGKPAYIYYISSGQLNVLAPDLAPGSVAVTVTNGGVTSAAVNVTASLYGPAFFPWPGSQPVATRQDYSYAVKPGTFGKATTTVAAKPGEVIILWGTGFGPTFPAAPVGVAVPATGGYTTASAPTVSINNLPATVYGGALAPGAAGLYQIAIQVPGTLADGDWPIQTSIGGVTSPTGIVLSVHQ